MRETPERIVTRSGPHHVRSILSLCLSLSAPLPSLSDVVGSPASFVTLYHLQPPFVPEDVRSVGRVTVTSEGDEGVE